MLNTLPDTEHLLSEETLESLPAGMKLALVTRISDALSQQVADPNDWYSELARFGADGGTDWGTKWATLDNSALSAPDDFHETLPGVLHNWRQANRALDNTMLSLAVMADRAVKVDKESILGVPATIKKWRSGHGYIADRLGIETRQAGQYRDRADVVRHHMSTVDEVGQEPQLPLVAQAYQAGDVPPENLDSLARSMNMVSKYLSAVKLTPAEIRDVFRQLDETFRNAVTTVKPRELAQLTDNILAQAAAIIDADGPPPEEVLKKVENSIRYKIVNGKLDIRILTDVINLELFLGIIYAGLNFRKHRDRYHSVPEEARQAAEDAVNSAPETHDDAPDSSASKTTPDAAASPDEPASEPDADRDETEPECTQQSFLDDVLSGLPADATPEQILAAAEQRIDDELNDPTVFAETMDGRTLSREEMKRLDPRSRQERMHDIYFAHLRATGRLDPSIHGLSIFGGAPTQLRVALDYETFTNLLDDRLEDAFHVPEEHRRSPGLEGFDPGPPRYLHGLELAAEQLIDTVDDDGTTMIEIDVSKYSDGDGKLRIPKRARGHPFISRSMFSGTMAPQHFRAQLCDAEIIPHVLGSSNVVLDRGRAVRTYSNSVKRDLATYGSCSIPDCRIPPAYTDGHHLIWWSRGGKTSSQNVTLLCPRCHTLVHQRVWTPVFDANGQLYWKPAPWLDSTQTPVRNTYWG